MDVVSWLVGQVWSFGRCPWTMAGLQQITCPSKQPVRVRRAIVVLAS
ncbi:hypothetical protein [Nocardia sp. CDC160]|nr:hypothetical protein [Nocardia sp. CDC160]MEC3920267.1 hypothetical protein [Nocardia sp. CDC160]